MVNSMFSLTSGRCSTSKRASSSFSTSAAQFVAGTGGEASRLGTPIFQSLGQEFQTEHHGRLVAYRHHVESRSPLGVGCQGTSLLAASSEKWAVSISRFNPRTEHELVRTLRCLGEGFDVIRSDLARLTNLNDRVNDSVTELAIVGSLRETIDVRHLGVPAKRPDALLDSPVWHGNRPSRFWCLTDRRPSTTRTPMSK